jgi:hypothetical protein
MKVIRVIRFSRYYSEYDLGSAFSKGGMTYVFDLDYNAADKLKESKSSDLDENSVLVKVGFSICSLSENFSKKIGVEIATERLEKDPISFFSNQELEGLSLVDLFWVKFNNYKFYRNVVASNPRSSKTKNANTFSCSENNFLLLSKIKDRVDLKLRNNEIVRYTLY